ncbi:ATP-binding cassette domain-containing protein [Dolosigranulum pigrum]|jgi:ABC transporter, ATP-binding protein|uniref:ATP-binding cassette domain-containing protein n=1 Tax=Dolosigranulum pigrum TaxID=29394 RepID=A0A516GH16_9LACT|nr:ATP-binding cassette domain-containing protein [Dolosigranulum pigrum]QDO90813.1 ATP-binding cassette domain-containing protein [Dolosigranulum pigrum]QTJ37499.1 ATP-binding cassette domain-containing protein [Dolosigranulum pigrum]QTJ40893.1 ATP-binding cassette domain-containing protein [Dolosigranulum pigrum]QTJ55733.1 ATP-binding cassette domain-containing protein [Dolosigranulum pigrum]VTU65726.1 sodium ABC transporter ATP-binding protein [Lactobacillus murinus] [Dolosigranulum pigrum]
MLEVSNLRKSFGETVAVDGLSFTIEPGEIMGLIGQNGAGKTTTFRLILNLLVTNAGQTLWNGESIGEGLLDNIGYLPEERGLDEKLTVEQQLLYLGQLNGMTKREVTESIDIWMDRFQVKGDRKDKISSLSKGNQQKVQLIATLMHEPDLIILDEPFSGLDPVNAELLEDGIRHAAKRGASIIFSSHNMANVESLCQSVVMLKNGRQVLGGTIDEVKSLFDRLKIYLEAPIATAELEAISGVQSVEQLDARHRLIHIEQEAVGRDVFEAAHQSGTVYQFSQQAPTLEEIFKERAVESDE